jgi:hypothetical protein
MRLSPGSASMRFGAMRATRGTCGQGLFDARFRFFSNDAPASDPARYNPATLGGMIGTNGFVTSPSPGIVVAPIFDASGALLTELPLCNAALTAMPSADRRCIGQGQVTGGRFNECSSSWTTNPRDTLRAVITAAAARQVRVSALNTTLCNLLAGSDCNTVPQAMWVRQPDTMGCGAAGWSLTAEFAAVSMLPE